MTILRVLQYPDPKLKRLSVEVTDFNEQIHQVIHDMFETHYSLENCAALAATQLDLDPPWRITVIDFSAEKNKPLCLVNPFIIESSGEQNEYEGCMSVYPNDIHEKVKRAKKIKVKAQDKDGNPFELEAEDFLAKCIQHEIDHLDGKIYLDRLSSIKKERINKRIKKIQRLLSKG